MVRGHPLRPYVLYPYADWATSTVASIVIVYSVRLTLPHYRMLRLGISNLSWTNPADTTHNQFLNTSPLGTRHANRCLLIFYGSLRKLYMITEKAANTDA
jgi:hypothetical protein